MSSQKKILISSERLPCKALEDFDAFSFIKHLIQVKPAPGILATLLHSVLQLSAN